MATTRYIDGSYPAGYTLGAGITNLTLGSHAFVGGTGVTGSPRARTTIDNRGSVVADPNQSGVTLHRGGMLTNEGAATLTGYHGVVVAGAAGTVVNSGVIASQTRRTGNSTVREDSLVLEAGGRVENHHGATIASGVNVDHGRGSIQNDGVISGEYDLTTYAGGGFRLTTKAGVQLFGGGKVENGLGAANALIKGGVEISGGPGQIDNAGIIIGYADLAAGSTTFQRAGFSVLMETGSVRNRSGGNLMHGVSITGATTIVNSGHIGAGAKGGGAHGSYIYLYDSITIGSGRVTNGSAIVTGATIDRGLVGVDVRQGGGLVTNFGTIIGRDDELSTDLLRFSAGVELNGGGTVVNGSGAVRSALIVGYDAGVFATGGPAFVTNFGSIIEVEGEDANEPFDGYYGVMLKAGGAIVNGSRTDPKASIIGEIGVELYGVATVTNFGSIVGLQAAIVLHESQQTLVEEGCGTLSGTVIGGGGTLLLDGKGGAGMLTGLGTAIDGFARIVVAETANWTLTGSNVVGQQTEIVNTGSLRVGTGAVVHLNGDLEGHGKLTLAAGSKVEFDNEVGANQTIVFGGRDTTLTLGDLSEFRGAIDRFGGGTETILLENLDANTKVTYLPNADGGGGALLVRDAHLTARIRLLGDYVAAGFSETAGSGGVAIVYRQPPPTLDIAPPAG